MTLKEKTDAILQNLASANLKGKYEDVVDMAEIPYQANLNALKALDIKNDREKGLDEAELMLAGIDFLITELESYRDALQTIEQESSAIFR